ncbi:hypothetical protein HSRCO_1720 [Halanaeroarchaeum sp. HSR-CO]|uniref:hypothetical protein n=1 Tax=Halanaeroarchaeum sp. HSR-CO TaxID=2866382 RepID=UPI00217EDC1D|nr:hypothetical protein [Halanaeroarchaeum sp. HSR-CO]UWG47999.1 hypothetical protein HSRCO_1720 [Halanaeroarchaeum sp. HSR-CO]
MVANVQRYAKPLVATEGSSVLVLLVLVGGLSWTPALFPVAAIAIFGLGYVTYLVPYLVVGADVGIVEALVQSVSLTLDRSEAIVAFLVFLATGAIISVPVSKLACGNGIVGASSPLQSRHRSACSSRRGP